MRVCIVGHGKSALEGDPDSHDFVIRLKEARKFVGARSDAVCATTMRHWNRKREFWLFNKTPNGQARNIDYDHWMKYYADFRPTYKPSIGLCAIFGAKEFLDIDELTLLGFDSWKGEYDKYNAPRTSYLHDAGAEKRCAESLFGVIHGT